MQFTAFMASLFLHLLLIIFFTTFTGLSRETPIDLDKDIHMVELVYMAEPEPEQVQAPEPPAPPSPPEPEPVPEPEKPEVQIPEEPRPKPDPPPEPKPEPKPEPEQEPEPEPEPKRESPPKKTPTSEERLAQELAALRKNVEESNKGRPAQKKAGLLEVYAAIAKEHIKKNWRFARIGGTGNLVVRVEVKIDSTGRITSTRILKTSGREDFDHSALRAVEDTGKLPEPPSTKIRTLIIDFNLNDLV
ncbi:MAG: energy transducer TonB [Desulfonatronovibrio sp.]